MLDAACVRHRLCQCSAIFMLNLRKLHEKLILLLIFEMGKISKTHPKSTITVVVSFIYPPSHAPHLYAVQEAPGEIVELTHKDVGHNGEPVCVLHLPCVGDEGLNVTGKGQRYRQENGPPSLNVVRELDLVQVQQSIFRLHPLEA